MKRKVSILNVIVVFIMINLLFSCNSEKKPVVRNEVKYYEYEGQETYMHRDPTMYVPSPDYGRLPDLSRSWTRELIDSAHAIRLAAAILESVYGNDIVEIQKPLKLYSVNDEIWQIEGSKSRNYDFYMLIQKSDCRIIDIAGYSYDEYCKRLNATTTSGHTWYDEDFFRQHEDFLYNEKDRIIDMKGFRRLPIPDSTKDRMVKRVEAINAQPWLKEYNDSLYRAISKGYHEIYLSWLENVKDNGYTPSPNVYECPGGLLKDPEIAAKAGIIILSAACGDEDIAGKLPVKVTLMDNKEWSIVSKSSKGSPNGPMEGGAAYTLLQKSDCRTFFVWKERH